MKHNLLSFRTLWFGVSLSILTTACTTNTKIDDGSYRSIGQKAPKQTQNYAAKIAAETARKKPTIKVGKHLEPAINNRPSSHQPIARLGDSTGNVPSDQSSQIVRFGHPRLVNAIVQTAQIHCRRVRHQIDASKPNFWGKGAKALDQCTYRFPDHCGGHEFSILSHNNKSILVYQPPKSPHYIMDTLSGTPKSKLGLWDMDDHLGSHSTNAGYIFQEDYNQGQNNQGQNPSFNPSSLGWIISASHQDQKIYGSLYQKALTDSSGCF